MKKIFNLCGSMVVFIHLSFAQTDRVAEKILNNMHSNYASIKNFKANFEQKIFNILEHKVIDSYKGEIVVSKNKYKIILDDQEIYNNGLKMWNYNKEFNEVYISGYEEDDENNLQNPSKIYAIYKKDFKYFKTGETKIQNKLCHIIDLIPKNIDKVNYFKIKVFITKATKQILSWQIFEKGNQIRYDYNIINFLKNNKLPENFFKFNISKHPQVEIIE